jgi:hypothetical protein
VRLVAKAAEGQYLAHGQSSGKNGFCFGETTVQWIRTRAMWESMGGSGKWWTALSASQTSWSGGNRAEVARSLARGRSSLCVEWAQGWVDLGPFKPRWRVASGRFNSGMGLHCSARVGPLKPFQLLEDFSNNQKILNSKIQHLAILTSKKYSNFVW